MLVATVRALKAHSGWYTVSAGRPLPEGILAENPDDVHAGAANLRKQIENVRIHGVAPVVAINAFSTDHPSEHAAIREIADSVGVRCAVCTHFAEGGKGAAELAAAVAEAVEEPSEFAFLYPNDATLREKIRTVASRVYGARGVEYDFTASRQLDSYERNGLGRLPVCIAKTHLSISSDPTLEGAPTGWVLPVREARASVGAGFIYLSVADLLDRLAAKQPAPGGGAAAAITAAIAAGLLGMAARFSAAQLSDSASRAAYADRMREQVAALAEQDAEAYQAVLTAFALPSEPDPILRRRQIRRTLERAAAVPTEIAEVAGAIATEAVELVGRGNPNLRGDAFTAATLAAAAARAAAELVRLNVELGKLDSDLADRAAHAADTAAKAVHALSGS